MTDYPRIQFSKMVGKDQLVLRGETAEEILELTAGLAKEAASLNEAVNIFSQVAMAAETFAGKSDSDAGSGTKSSGKTCPHGEMEEKSGKKKNGGTWTGHFCPEKKCEVVWA